LRFKKAKEVDPDLSPPFLLRRALRALGCANAGLSADKNCEVLVGLA
jgi:hypothetical protein